jgi:chemotaxis protein MotB
MERWLVSYADFITLLFATFVMLYAISRADIQKFKAVAESLKAAFSAEFVDQAGKSSGKSLNQFQEDLPIGGLVMDLPAGRSNIRAPDNEDLKRLADILEESISYELGASDFAEKLQITYDDRGVVVRLSAKDFYQQGSAEVKREALPILDHIAKILKATDRQIRIEGHTDNSKVASPYYPSNWELSTSRAAWIVRYLVQKFKFEPKRLEAAGYAEYRPVAPNTTEAGRAKNRRVEILVLSKDTH